jgi:hypothetical protein
MKVFVSWSGDLSQRVAQILRDWLPNVIQTVELYVSSEDVDKGARWFTDIANELESAEFGIICLTRDNMIAPWILFESGAISKSITQSRVVPLLIDITPTDLKGPLAQFQAATTAELDVKKLVKAVNGSSNEKRLNEFQIETAFNKWWPDLHEQLKKALEQTDGGQKKPSARRSEREILEELLQINRAMFRTSQLSRVRYDIPEGRTSLQSIFKRLQRALEERGKPLLAAALDGAKYFHIVNNRLDFAYDEDAQHLVDTLLKSSNFSLLQEVCDEILGRGTEVNVYSDEKW